MFLCSQISIDGHTEISFTEDVAARYEALGWHVIHVKDGNTDYDAIRKAIEDAKKVTDKPTLIKVRTSCAVTHAQTHRHMKQTSSGLVDAESSGSVALIAARGFTGGRVP